MNSLLKTITLSIFLLFCSCFYLNAKSSGLQYGFGSSAEVTAVHKNYEILSESDVEIYVKIFMLQSQGMFADADALRNLVDNKILIGYVDYQKYISKSYRSSFEELKTWMLNNGGNAFYKDIYRIARIKYPKNTSSKYRKGYYKTSFEPIYKFYSEIDYHSQDDNNYSFREYSLRNYNSVDKKLSRHLRDGHTLNIKNILKDPANKRTLGTKKYSYYSSRLAKFYFLDNHDDYAIEWANVSIKASAFAFPDAYYIAGLASYRKGDLYPAYIYMSQLADAELSEDYTSSAAYWAAVIAARRGDVENYNKYLEIASSFNYTFYGIIASYEINNIHAANYKSIVIKSKVSSLDEFLATPKGMQILSLIQVGLLPQAEREIIKLLGAVKNPKKAKDLYDAAIYVAGYYNLPHLTYKLAGNNGYRYGLVGMTYPSDLWNLSSDIFTDKSLTLAIMRRESAFNVYAGSSVGAKGLMQLMPNTANIVVRNSRDIQHSYHKSLLIDPSMNIKVGQSYIEVLMNSRGVKNDLIYTLAGWNGGLNNVRKWRAQKHRTKYGSLFFIESIPYYETRYFLKDVLKNYWIYQIQNKEKLYSIQDIVTGQYPVYREK